MIQLRTVCVDCSPTPPWTSQPRAINQALKWNPPPTHFALFSGSLRSLGWETSVAEILGICQSQHECLVALMLRLSQYSADPGRHWIESIVCAQTNLCVGWRIALQSSLFQSQYLRPCLRKISKHHPRLAWFLGHQCLWRQSISLKAPRRQDLDTICSELYSRPGQQGCSRLTLHQQTVVHWWK